MKKLALSFLTFVLAWGCGGSAAQAAITLTLVPSASTVALGHTITLTATVSGTTTTTALNWYVNNVQNGNATQGTLTACTTGATATTRTCTYNAPAANVPNPNPLIFKALSLQDNTTFKTATATVTDSIAVSLSPASASIPLSGTSVLTATISGTTNTALLWYVNGVLTGNAAQGTLTACTTVAPWTCKYTAPLVNVPSPNPAVIRVASAADPAKFKTASVTVTDTIAVTLSPTSKSLPLSGAQLFTATITGTNGNSALNWYVNGVLNGNAAQGTLTGTGLTRTYTVPPVNVPSPNPAVIKVASAADPGKYKTANVTVTDSIAVTISPTVKSLALSATQLFTATITGTNGNSALNWYVNGVLNGNAAQGTLTGTGLTRTYTAPPVNVPSPNPAAIKVASAADPGKYKTATVTVTDSVAVTLSPSSATMATGGTQLFTATITGTNGNAALNWYVNGVLNGNATQGTLTGTGLTRTYAAPPAHAPDPNPAVIKVASAADPAKYKTASVKITAAFGLTGSLPIARYSHTATLLNNGMVLVAGGAGPGASTSASLYNPATGTFAPTGNLNTYRYPATATLLNNGTVLVAGGSSGASAELYNPATGTFAYTTGSMNAVRSQHTATVLNNGMVLIAGGEGNTGALASAELYNPTTGTFTPTGSLKTARYQHTATLLNNGMVLITGGNDSSYSPTASAELYNPATGTFSYTTGGMSTARFADTATLLNNGMVLVAGGYNQGFIASAELYTPATGKFTLTATLNTARSLHTATLLNDGMVLIAGGVGPVSGGSCTATAELYDPATGTFAATGSLDVPRSEHTAALLNNGMVLMVAGSGTTTGSGPYEYLATAELYEPATLTPPDLESIAITPSTRTLSPGTTGQFMATGTFSDTSKQQLASVTWSSSNTTLAQMSNDAGNHGLGLATAAGTVTIKATAGSVSGSATLTVRPTGFIYTGSLNANRAYHTATLLNNGTVLVAGGNNSSGDLASAELYNPAAGTFTPTGSLHTARKYHTATGLNNGMVLMTGGIDSSGSALASAELYNPATGTFTPTGSLHTARYSATATLLNNGLTLIAGGLGSTGAILASAELYNPATGTFTATGSFNSERMDYTATLLNDGMVLIAGGGDLAAELFNPATGKFTLTGSLHTPRSAHTAVLLKNGMVLLAGGLDSMVVLSTSAELYDPATGSFTLTTGDIITPRYDHTATLLNSGMVLLAGGFGSSGPALASAELYNPATGEFAVTGSLNTARVDETATLLTSGMVLLAGGDNSSGSVYLASAELY